MMTLIRPCTILEAVITANRLVMAQQAHRHQALIEKLISPPSA